MKICIISDLHCKYQNDVNSPSNTLLFSNQRRIPANQHPIAALLETIQRENLNADVLICPGDLGDKADEQGIISSWNFLEEIRHALDANELIGIPGNHDVNSHGGVDSFSFIKNFHHKFPTKDIIANNSFWSLGFCVFKFGNILILLINTVHDHIDIDSSSKSNLDAGMLERIEKELIQILGEFDLKICIMHHHPIKHSNITNYRDSDSVDRGDDLVNLLSRFHFNILIHGHKHQPRMTIYNGLAIFACGSFASSANLQGTGIQQMFHIVELFENSKNGKIESWEYSIIDGWTQNLNIEEVARLINELYVEGDRKPFFFEKILKKISGIEYLDAEKLTILGRILRETYNLEGRPSFPLQPNSIGELIK